jgi:hypothetical protein
MDRGTRVERRVQPLERVAPARKVEPKVAAAKEKVRAAVKEGEEAGVRVVEEAAVRVVEEAAVRVVEEAAVRVVEEAASGQLLIWIRIKRTSSRYSRSALSSNSIQ